MSKLDELYVAWMQAEYDEQAALLMLGARDDVEVRAAAEIATEKRDAAREAYELEASRLRAVA